MLAVLLVVACPSTSPPRETPPSAPVSTAPPRPALDPGAADAAYTVTFPEVAAHRVHVEVSARCPDTGALTWWMPTWTPGSYLIREYAQHIEQMEGLGAQGLVPVVKVAKNRWSTACSPGQPSGLRYRLYARGMSVRGSFVDAELGVLNGASTFVFPDIDDLGVLDVTLTLPETWSQSQTALEPHPSGTPHRYLAADVDTLVDSPILLGNPDVRSFEVQGTTHHVVTLGTPGPWDHAQALEDIQRVTETQVAFWGDIPYPHYHYLVVLAERGGGLEHRNSTLMMTRRFQQTLREDRIRWLGLVSHEFFHTWNIKRLRPAGLGPFDYENEVYTPSLWIAEGFTSYYDDLLLRRAGLITEREYLDRLGANIASVRDRPGRLVQPLGEASFDAWVKHYRRNENSDNAQTSYYTKGALVAWMLDAEIRRATQDRQSLDDLMRLARSRFGNAGYTPEAFRDLASEVSGSDLSTFFVQAVDTPGELDLGGAMQWWGLRFSSSGNKASKGDDPPVGTLGADTANRNGRLFVTKVLRDSGAWHAGLNVDDEILALDAERLTGDVLSKRLAQWGQGHTGTLLVSRRGRLLELPITLDGKPAQTWRVEADPGASPIAQRRRSTWLRN